MVFFLAPNLSRQVSVGPVQPLLGLFHGFPIQPNLIVNKKIKKIKNKTPNTNTNQSTLLSVKSSNYIYHLWKTQNSDFYIYGQIFTSTQHSLRFLHIESSNKYPKTKTTKRGNEPRKKNEPKEEEEELRPINLSSI